jgi:hypothetical protein
MTSEPLHMGGAVHENSGVEPTIVVPTLNERDNIRPLLDRLEVLRHRDSALKSRALSTSNVALTAPRLIMVVLIAALLTIVLATYDQYGFTVDEFKGLTRAIRIFDFLMSAGVESAELSAFSLNNFYGAAPDVLALSLQKLVPALSYDSRHLVFALFGVAGIFYVYLFGSKFTAEWVGVFAALFLASTPLWFGYMFINHKDIPFAATLIASSYHTLSALTEYSISRLSWLKTGLAIGLLATTKIIGLLVLGFIVVVFLACLLILSGEK